ncbi:hypothetical protein Moror_13202 [Moniliophthora roreri MCA 2997]|uniref:Uncharacterized protein n=2 Tax=Moniliophthora roreri TaxID=221103 RepID=V2YB74_MONRO|nr:hypothetical protein Moror_13202 [Moniliophthora roreri MCA 2997]KAI3615544.1 hypothetical protein WG66_011707 [Moniliophthora roreri]
MWCTRWFLPLFLLPLPTAPPFFLILLVVSLTVHAKPCFYCIVLLGTLFISTCYWQPLPLETPLSRPWSDNITTFGDALNDSLISSGYWLSKYAQPLPSVIHPVDRCWCDFAAGTFFEPFNTTNWEILSVKRVKEGLQRRVRSEEEKESLEAEEVVQVTKPDEQATETEKEMPRTVSPYTTALSRASSMWGRNSNGTISVTGSIHSHVLKALEFLGSSRHKSRSDEVQHPSRPENSTSLRPFRKEYNLQPYGVGIVIDFNWSGRK